MLQKQLWVVEGVLNLKSILILSQALPQKYSHYRPILGDGNCGWRGMLSIQRMTDALCTSSFCQETLGFNGWRYIAIGFSYYESLLRSQNRNVLEEEIARIISLNNLLTTAGGYDTWLFEDMVEQTTDLLRDLAEVVETSPDVATILLLARFNEQDSLNIIYHMRLLASASLASNSDSYQGFIPDGLTVDEYRKTYLETVNTEIEHMGLSLLINVLLRPLGIAVEIVYLDRSEGSQANTHTFQSEDSNGLPTNPGGPKIHLLYRPSHYDILYSQGSVSGQLAIETVAQNSDIQVNRATSLSHQRIQNSTSTMGDFSQLDLQTLMSIPGYAMAPQPSHIGYQTQYHPPLDPTYSHSPISASISPISPEASVATPSSTTTMAHSYTAQQPILQQNHPSPNTPSSSHGLHTFPRSTTLPIHTQHPTHESAMHRPSSSTHPSMNSELSSPACAPTSFRPSVYEYTAAAEHEPIVFQTNTFKNSHYNTAHYNNPNFQPEEWTPDADDMPVPRKKSNWWVSLAFIKWVLWENFGVFNWGTMFVKLGGEVYLHFFSW